MRRFLISRGVIALLLTAVIAAAATPSFAVDGKITAKGGGEIIFTGAESATTIPGTTDVLLKFLGEGTYTLPGMTKARILAIGGGGGGGGAYYNGCSGNYGGGGGGGAGAFVETNDQYGAATYAVSVGAGGAGGKMSKSSTANYDGSDGGNTVILKDGVVMLTAAGGGGGGAETVGHTGGSGGGGSMKKVNAVVNAGGQPLDSTQGSAGGTGDRGLYGGGGGGAGGAGAAASTTGGGVGGIGKQSDISGTMTYYAGGGGGGFSDYTSRSGSAIPGGSGVGGNGGWGVAGVPPTQGKDGTGSGGGGCDADCNGAKGGSGVVYVRISGAISGGLKKPEDRSEKFTGATFKVVEDDTNPFYNISGENEVSEIGIHSVLVTPIAGVEWSTGGSDPVIVTLTITDPDAFSGTAYVTGAPIHFEGVKGTNWVNGELILMFTSVGNYTLPGTSQARILAVGGGGGGGGAYYNGCSGNYGGGGGGGAGAFVETNDQYGAATYAVSVGAGGAGGKMSKSSTANYDGSDGGNTVILKDGVVMLTAAGGGGGGAETVGHTGGSGGGGSMKKVNAVVNAGGQPLDSTQGSAGGTGDRGLYGGGGGGAGGAGAAASTTGGGVGGLGMQSDITLPKGTDQAAWPYYAGGGGGGFSDYTQKSGGAAIPGGSGIGGNGGWGAAGIPPTQGKDGTGSGGGGCDADCNGAKGGSGIVYVRISTAMEGEFKKPTDPAPIAYDRNAHTSIVNTAFYTVKGQNIGTNAGSYVATATLKEGVTWPPPEGGIEDVTVTMTITNRAVTFADLNIADWEYKTPTEKTPKPSCTVDPAWVAPYLVYEYSADRTSWSTAKPTEKGAYQLRVRIREDVAANYLVVNPEATVSTFKITPIHVEFSNLTIRDWMYGTPADKTPEPTCTVSRPDVPAVYEYKNRDEGRGTRTEEEWKLDEEGWEAAKPSAVGNYWVRVRAPDFDNYDFEIQYADFQIFAGRADRFTDWVEITIAGYSGEPQTDFPYVITLKDDDPVGFLHERAGLDGEELCFTDAADNVLPYKVVSWNPDGTSQLCVQLATLGAASQKIRLYWRLRKDKEAPGHAYEPAETTVTQPGYTCGLVSRDGYFVNYWLKEPSMSKEIWASTEPPGALTPGVLAEGTPKLTVYNAYTGETRPSIPTTEVGAFRLFFEPDDLRGIYESGSGTFFIDIRITGEVVVDNLRGTAGDETLNGRVLLANDDEVAGHAITGQGYWQQRVVEGETYDTYWEHSGEHYAPTGDDYFPYLLAGVNHTLSHINADQTTNVLWRLKDVMLGNQIAKYSNQPVFHLQRAYLPWESTARGISTKAAGAAPLTSLSEVGNLVLRNRENAAVYSPCYSDGIGTIYFDVTKGEKEGDAASYQIVVEVATETSDDPPLPPTDENSRAKTGESTFPHLGAIGDSKWVARELHPLKKDGTATFEPQPATKALDLALGNFGTTNNFYRVYVPVNVKGPARFRIRRTSTVNAGGEVTPQNDRGGFILLDNLLVSYPQSTAKVKAAGFYDKAKEDTPRLVLGQEGAMTVPFPAIGEKDVFARATPDTYVSGLTNVSAKTLIPSVTMHYRWRYLNQQVGAWKEALMNPAHGYISDRALEIPDKDGDVEYWFENTTQIPYYRYFDYSGTGLGLQNSGYSEAVGSVTNVWQLAEDDRWLPSGGTNWFFRLRLAKSDYEAIKLVVQDPDGVGIGNRTLDFELAGDHVWRAFLPTPAGASGTVRFQVRALNLQTPGDETFAWNTNVWRASVASVKIGSAGMLETTDAAGWTTLEVDDQAGYAMIQVKDTPESRTFLVTHGEQQDFRLWTDANKKDGKGHFVGQSELDGANPSGTSSRTREFPSEVTNWQASVAVDLDYWRETFSVLHPEDPTQLPVGVPFASTTTPNHWSAGPGEWAAGCYSDLTSGRALQMKGQGYGFIELTDAAKLPRGLRQISFAARLAQNQSFTDVCYWDEPTVGKSKFKNYTFVAKAAFDLKKATSFAGAASVSLLAYYRPGVGCYEFRITQKASDGETPPKGPGSQRTLQLYRWAPDAKYQMTATPLGAPYDLVLDSMAQTEGETAASIFPMLFISCETLADNATVIRAGVSKTAVTPATYAEQASAWLVYKDTSDKHPTAGTFGLTGANCPARFCYPLWYDKPVSGGPAVPTAANTLATTWDASQKIDKPLTPTWQGNPKACFNEISGGEWMKAPDRFEYAALESSDPSLVGFRVRTIPQALEVYTAKYDSNGKAVWSTTPINTFDVTGFGSNGQSAKCVVPLYTTDDRLVRIQMAGTALDPRCDVVIDDIQLEQWCGESYDDTPHKETYPETQLRYGLPTNFVFTQAWIQTNASNRIVAHLNAKRSKKGVATSIRSPLMDGQTGHGSGLGSISFAWANAQPNAKLLVQIATNGVEYATLPGVSKSVEAGVWTTVATIDFSTMTEQQRRDGDLVSYYFGLHGVTGLMRLALDPATVDAVKDVTDEGLFGAVDILSVMCTDEPALDARSWWGWNLRTTDDESMLGLNDQRLRDRPSGGLAFALNNSVSDDIRKEDGDAYPNHLPFLQTPQLATNLIGEVTFRARKYNLSDAQTYVVVYGSAGGKTVDKDWVKLESFEIKEDTYKTYALKLPQGSRYASLRLAVVGVEGIVSKGGNGYMPGSRSSKVGHGAYRVLIDDVTVTESVDARIGFRNVRPFRFGLDNALAVTDILSENEQPLVDEAWGVQGEIFAAQLSEEVDLTKARVRLSWYVGTDVWGFDQWKNSPKAKSAWVKESSDVERIFRSSYLTCASAVVPLVDAATTVQYMLEVVWKTTDGVMVTNRVLSSEWEKPEWYRGLDYNRTLGKGAEDRFSPFTVLDTVAPHWAWINEANILGEYTSSFANTDKDCQFVEIAAPAVADLTGWQVRMLTCDTTSVLTNTAATFGLNGLSGTKQDLLGQASGLVFRVIGSDATYKSGRLNRSKGEIDGKWAFNDPDVTLQVSGEIGWTDPFAIQLVRPTGIIEHEIVLMGYNYWGAHSRYPEDYDPTNTVNSFNALMPGSKFFYAGADDTFDAPLDPRGRLRSLSVFDGKGATNQWDRMMVHTPGRINEYSDGTPQILRGEPPMPSGDTVLVHCNLGGDGKLVQTVGTAEDSPYDQIIILPKGSPTGTNITYTATNWYELGVVTTNGLALSAADITFLGSRRWSVNVGRGVSNGFTVVANADVCKTLRDLGVTDDNRFKAAIMDWFEKGVDMYGRPWPDSDGEVYPVAFRDLGFNFVTNLSITETYWLDICPTITNQHLVGGMSKAPEPLPVALRAAPKLTGAVRLTAADYGVEWGEDQFTNRQMSVKLMITNANPDKVLGPRAWSPYVIRSVTPGETSWDFKTNRVSSTWASGTFKVSGILMNGLTSQGNSLNWVPLRWFVFAEDSFFQPGDPACQPPYNREPFTSEIEVADPAVPGTAGYDAWGSWVKDHCGGIWPEVFFRWELNERRKMYEIEVLKKTNYLSK